MFNPDDLATIRELVNNDLEGAQELLSEMHEMVGNGYHHLEVQSQVKQVDKIKALLQKVDAVLAEPEKSSEVSPLKGFTVEQLNIVVDSVYGEWKYMGTMTHGGRLWAPLDKATTDIFREVHKKED